MKLEYAQIEIPASRVAAITMAKSELAALLAFASTDETRSNICGLGIEPHALLATDGHRLVHHFFEASKSTLLPELRVIDRADLDRLFTAAKSRDLIELRLLHGNIAEGSIWDGRLSPDRPASGAITMPLRYVLRGKDFVAPPPTDQILRAYDDDAFVSGPIGLNAHYLADVQLISRAIEAYGRNKAAPNVEVRRGGEREPVDFQFCDRSWRLVIMPVRIDATPRRAAPSLSKAVRDKLETKLFADVVGRLAELDSSEITRVEQYLRRFPASRLHKAG